LATSCEMSFPIKEENPNNFAIRNEDITSVAVQLVPDVNKRSLTRLFSRLFFHVQSINAMSVTFSRTETRQRLG